MITLSHLISDIRDIASSGSNPIDFKISDENITYWINQVRATIISQSISKRNPITDDVIQTIGCIELEQVDKSLCCGIDTGCVLLRSKLVIPGTINTDEANLILSVTGLDGTQIHKSNQFRAKYKSFNKYTKFNKSWYLQNNYLYVINDLLLSEVAITGVFEDPTELSTFICNGESCFNISTSLYPINNKMASVITDTVIKTKVLPFLQFPADNQNNAKSDDNQVSKNLSK